MDKCKLIMNNFSQLFPVHDDDRIYVFHKSIVDWFTGEPPFDDRRDIIMNDAVEDYVIDRAACHRRIARAGARVVLPF